MRTIRIGEKEDLNECIEVLLEAFLHYDFTKVYCVEEGPKRRNFYREIFRIAIELGLERKQLIVLEEDGVIKALMMLQAPEDKDFSVMDYIKHGVIKALFAGGFKNLAGFIRLMDVSEVECHRIKEPHWYLSVIAVKRGCQKQGLGCYLLQEGMVPYIKERSGHLLAVVTNSKYNEQFYGFNGFKTIKEEWLHMNQREIGNWTMTLDIE